jgi:molybdopterin converting factor subunit 1
MNINIRFFARARDLAGSEARSLELPAGATVADLRRRLQSEVPALAELLPRCALSVNGEFVGDDLVLPAAAEVAVLPPVSGG